MEQIQQEAFVKMTIETHKNKKLEELIEEAKIRTAQIEKLAKNDNSIIRILAWICIMLLMFFFLPITLTGIFTKGMKWKEQQQVWLAVIIIVCLVYIRNVLF